MSETRKSQQASRESAQQVREAVQETAEGVTRSARVAAARTEDVIDNVAENARETSASVADTVARSADAAFEMTQRMAEQGCNAVWQGVCAAAGVNGRLADLGYGPSHRVLEQSARTLEIYREAGEATAEHLQARFASDLLLTRGMQEIQLVTLRMFDQATRRNPDRPQRLPRCKSMINIAGMQREFCVDPINYAMETGSTLLQIADRVAQEAMRPLQSDGARMSQQA